MLTITPQKRTATKNISSSGGGKKYIVCYIDMTIKFIFD